MHQRTPNPHPFAQSNRSGLSKGVITKVDSKTFYFEVTHESYSGSPLVGKLPYSYCHIPLPNEAGAQPAGIIAMPKVGAKVLYERSGEVEFGLPVANILCYITGRIATGEFMTGKRNSAAGIPVSIDAKERYKQVPQNPGWEQYANVYNGKFTSEADLGFSPGDMAIVGSAGNKLKIMDDGSMLVKSTPYNFMWMIPSNNKFYQWSGDYVRRTFGSYHANYNVIFDTLTYQQSFHYSVNKYFANPSGQTTTFQEEYGFVDPVLSAVAGGFTETPHKDMCGPIAAGQNALNNAAKTMLDGYSVYKKTVFDSDGRGLTTLPAGTTFEYFCEEIKSDGSLRIRVGKKNIASGILIPPAVELYFKPDGSWSVGSILGKITCINGEMILSNAVTEVSLTDLVTYMLTHTHASAAGPVAPPVSTPIVKGLNTLYVKGADPVNAPLMVQSGLNLKWTT